MISPSTFQNMANNFFTQSFSGFVVNYTFTISTATSTYDPITNTYSEVGTTYDIPCIKMNFHKRQFDGDLIRIGDVRLLSRVASWTELGIVPKVEDTRVSVGGSDFQVLHVSEDAADALYRLHIRRL